MTPKVSVIIPTYNRRYCLDRTIGSVLAQTHQNVEIIVVDDAGTDGTEPWLKNYPAVKAIRNKTNLGISGARNVGFAASSGEFVAFLDDDDWWRPWFIERHLTNMAPIPAAVLSYCDFISVDERGFSPSDRRAVPFEFDQVRTLIFNNPIVSLTQVLMRRWAVERAGLFPECAKMCEDRDLYIRMAGSGRFLHLPESLAYKTRSRNSVSNDLRLWSRESDRFLANFYKRRESRRYLSLRRQASSLWKARIALVAIRSGQIPLGLRLAFISFVRDPLTAMRFVLGRVSQWIRK